MAIDNARAQEKQVQLEKTELKMELFRERELRETLEKQLAMEQKNRGKRLTATRRQSPAPQFSPTRSCMYVSSLIKSPPLFLWLLLHLSV